MPTPRIRTWTGKINNMEYTTFQSPDLEPIVRKSFTPGLKSITRLGVFEKPPILGWKDAGVVLPSVPTLRGTTTTTGARPTFFTSPSTSLKYSYTLTTHLIPSAYPRTSVPSASEPINTTEYERIISQADKNVREGLMVSYMDVLTGLSNAVNFLADNGENGGNGVKLNDKSQDSGVDANGNGNGCDAYRKACEKTKRVLWNCVNRIVRVKETEEEEDGREKVTLFVTHANGFPKETYEPAIQSLLTQFEETYSQSSSTSLPPIIDEIWLFEAIQHGDTGLINTGLLPRAFNWLDNVRDILHFLLYYIPDRVYRDAQGKAIDLPTHLPRLSDNKVSRRIKEGYPLSNRKIVGIGHSLGGCSLARAAIEYPSLFSAVVLVDPVLRPVPSDWHNFKFGKLPDSALRRRCDWRSKEEAKSSFLKSPFFRTWHPDVLDAYVNHAITEDKAAGVARLKMSGLHETIVFLHKLTSFETWQLLTELDSRIPLFWIVSGLDTTVLGEAEMAQETVWRRSANSSNVVLPVGHLIPHEAPVEFASLVRNFLTKHYSSRAAAAVGSDGVDTVDSPEVESTASGVETNDQDKDTNASSSAGNGDGTMAAGDSSLRGGSDSGTMSTLAELEHPGSGFENVVGKTKSRL